ncbi:MAG: hypothetical protein K9G76_08920 [Bacteroidales bacterium]|nr:hypothetical protein [Bacteroidales bacterium]MCF8405594.1 hypothetical protein [Bacteroidales bacterium]
MDGKQLQKSISAKSHSGVLGLAAEYLLLFGIGIIAILLHARLRTPLNIPGHHGLEFMALLMAGRSVSKIKWASSVSSLGIGFILLFPVFGFNDPFMGINYMFPGFLIDILYQLTRNYKRKLLILALISGFAYLSIPLSRLLIHLSTGYPYSSFLKHGYIAPILGFFVFGLAGGFVGTGVCLSIKKRLSR